MDRTSRVVTVGHAIVDVLAPCDDAKLAQLGLDKATMTLVDDARAEQIYAALGPAIEASGGAAANTAACVASLGGDAEFLGKVADDALGKVFAHDIRSAGVRFDVPSAPGGPGTGRCLVLVTPDAEKTMCTCLGVGGLLGPEDVDPQVVEAARAVYLEGYLCGKEETAPAVDKVVAAARAAGTLVAFSAADPAWVGLHRPALLDLMERSDIVFANEAEALGLSGRAGLGEAVRALAERCATVAVTLGAAGCVVASEGVTVEVPADAATAVVDTTGAGDSFAAGFLYGVVHGLPPDTSARLGGLAAAEIVSHMGARPQADLADLAVRAGLL